MNTGFINFYDNIKGYGFIRRESGRDLIFSHNDILNTEEIVDVYVNTKVEFEIEITKKGPRAIEIRFL